uniref:Uncharacterized protein n=1 Tax=Arundo donax TaxID=35708 RepID=A0A0A9F8Y0_ARUDO
MGRFDRRWSVGG